MTEFSPGFDPEEFLRFAEEQGVIKLPDEPIDFSNGPVQFPIYILDIQRWLEFLHTNFQESDDVKEKSFIHFLIQSFQHFQGDLQKYSGFNLSYHKNKNKKEAIKEEDVKKFKEKLDKIKTIDELLDELDKGGKT